MKHEKIVNSLVKKYKADKNVVGIYIFGSLAKGTAHEKSDVDIELIFMEAKKPYELKKKIIEGISIDLSCYRLDQFEKDFSKDYFLHYAVIDYKIIYDPKGILRKHLPKVKRYFKEHPDTLKFWKEKETKWKEYKKLGKKGKTETYFEIMKELKTNGIENLK